MNNKDVQLSKSLSWILRHGAIKEGLCVSPEGYVDVTQILQHKIFRGKYNKSDIERVVANNEKQRYTLRINSQTQALQIKANQGHTITQVTDIDLTPILQPVYEIVLHGTYLRNWPQIKTLGLSHMKRRHIHLAKGTYGDSSVISGLRRNAQVLIYIDLAKALSDGLQFFESDNGVILTAGNNQGLLEPKYFSKVIEISTGAQLYP